MKYTTVCNKYEQGGLKNVDIFSKIISFWCSWIKTLHEDSFHAWKVIPLLLIKNYLRKNVVFYSNLNITQKVVKKFPKFCQKIFRSWEKYLSSPTKFLSVVASQFIWYNKYIKIGNKTIYCYYFSQKNLNHVGDIFENIMKVRWEIGKIWVIR